MTFPIIPASTINGSYQISRSLRFRSSASAYLSRTPASAGNRQTWTWSGWVKRGTLGSGQTLFGRDQNGSGQAFAQLNFNSGDQLNFVNYSTTTDNVKTTTAVFRDVSAWYHIVLIFNSTNATASDRIQLWVNGVRQTSFVNSSDPTLNYNSYINEAGIQTSIGSILVSSRANYFDGYLAEVNFIDGQALTPSSFGAFDTNGVWQPIKYVPTGSGYGTNGFYLNFSDNSGATATTIGKDSSGNSNNWTPNNISVTSGTTYDSMIDSPTNYADGGNGRGNYAVLNAAAPANGLTISQANLYATGNATAGWRKAASTIAPSSGKWYFEVTYISLGTGASIMPGAETLSASLNNTSGQYYGSVTDSYGYYSNSGQKFTNAVNTNYGSSCTTNDVIGIAVDLDNGAIYFGKQTGGTGSIVWQNSGDPTSGASKTGAAFSFTAGNSYVMGCAAYHSEQFAINFGQRPFSATIPSGFSALNTQNLPTPTIAAGNKYFDATTYTGNGSSLSVTNSGSFQPDLVWVKSRSTSSANWLVNSVTGVNNGLISDNTVAEQVLTITSAFNSNGFTVNYASNTTTNNNLSTYVGWQWKAGGTGVTNNDGSLTSTVSVNQSAGFSIVKWTGTGATGKTVGHGLGASPNLIIAKKRNKSEDWFVGHTGSGYGNNIGYHFHLNTTGAVTGSNDPYYFDTIGSSNILGLSSGSANNGGNESGIDYIAYCWSAVAGYSAFGSYTGNGSADGPFIYLGFRPRWIMIKQTTASGTNWIIIDTSRSTYNVTTVALGANSSLDEPSFTTTEWLDVLSNGFKIKIGSANGGYTNLNISGNTYIYAAFAENPFKISRAR